MAHAFSADATGEKIEGRLDEVERELVLDALAQTRQLLQGEETEAQASGGGDLFEQLSASMQQRSAPTDPALRRLLPDGQRDDDDDAAEFRRLTEDTIRRQKLAHLDVALDALSRAGAGGGEHTISLTRVQARAVMMALTDVRLVLSQRLEIHTDEDAEALHDRVATLVDPESSTDITAIYYDFLTWLSESLTLAYLGETSD